MSLVKSTTLIQMIKKFFRHINGQKPSDATFIIVADMKCHPMFFPRRFDLKYNKTLTSNLIERQG